jgi:hypothetical protein
LWAAQPLHPRRLWVIINPAATVQQRSLWSPCSGGSADAGGLHMTTRGSHRLVGLAMLAGLASVHQPRAQAMDSAQVPAFVDASRQADLRAAWAAANAKPDAATTRERAEALSRRFAAEPPARREPAWAPAVVVPTETASIDKAPALPTLPPAVKKAKKPQAAPVAAANDDGKGVATKRRKQIKRIAKPAEPQPTLFVVTSGEELPSVEEESGANGPAGRLPTDYERWNLFPALESN